MSRKASPTLVGVFVLGAIGIFIFAIAFFGSGGFTSDKTTLVLNFSGNLSGLKVGAPVAFKGVRIGNVTRVMIRFDLQNLRIQTPVIIEIDHDQFQNIGNARQPPSYDSVIPELIDKGLRAQLRLQSFVTGMLYVELDFYPGSDAVMLSKTDPQYDIGLLELPTIPSSIEMLQEQLRSLPIDALVGKAVSALDEIEKILKSGDIAAAFDAFGKSMADVRSLAHALREEVPRVVGNANQVMTDVRDLTRQLDARFARAIADIGAAAAAIERVAAGAADLVATVDDQIKPLSGEIQNTLVAAQRSLQRSADAIDSIQQLTTRDAPMGYKIYNTLDELASAARAIRQFAEYLERHPEALIQGKGHR